MKGTQMKNMKTIKINKTYSISLSTFFHLSFD